MTSTIDQIKSLAEDLNSEEIQQLRAELQGLDKSPYTVKEVLTALEESGLLEDGWGELSYYLAYRKETAKLNLRGLTITPEIVEEDEGGEYSYNTFIILKIGGQFFRKTGHYQSHYGDDWDGPFVEVVPATETVTVYKEA